MSKNITIAEGNVGRNFGPVPRVYTPLQGENAGLCAWVPEDETEADTLHVTKNGTYSADSMGVYGWTEVEVNVTPESRGSDDSGHPWDVTIGDDGPEIDTGDATITLGDDGPEIDIDDHRYPIDLGALGFDTEKDITLSWDGDNLNICGTLLDTGNLTLGRYNPVTGDLSLTECPYMIVPTAFPQKTVYRIGENIDYRGLQVAGMDSNSNYIPISFSDLKLPLKKVPTDADGETLYFPDYEPKDGWGPLERPYVNNEREPWTTQTNTKITDVVCFSRVSYIERTEIYGPETWIEIHGIEAAMVMKRSYSLDPDGYTGILFLVSKSPITYDTNAADAVRIFREIITVDDVTYFGAWLPFGGHFFSQIDYIACPGLDAYIVYGGQADYVLRDMLRIYYGNYTPYDGILTAPIQWARPCDGQMLETSINLTVRDETQVGY